MGRMILMILGGVLVVGLFALMVWGICHTDATNLNKRFGTNYTAGDIFYCGSYIVVEREVNNG